MALMLILVIFLFGIITVLSILNIRLFQELKVKRQETDISISFATEATVPLETEEMALPEPASIQEPLAYSSMQLQQTPQSRENIPVEGGLSLQEIYTRNIDSVVSISCSGYNSGSTGTGVILSSDGYIVTNAHVVDGAGSINVISGRTIRCDESLLRISNGKISFYSYINGAKAKFEVLDGTQSVYLSGNIIIDSILKSAKKSDKVTGPDVQD